ncbi:MAG: carboxypeptidase regulatory-like domain-containing protein [Chloroflexi bacterium]|nr:carboxypeptidase regulatory-like domain-containing protein [Chloroflexota bacterium]
MTPGFFNALRRVLTVVAALTAGGILLFVALVGVAVYVMSKADWTGWGIPPQDCMGTTFSVKGYVTDEDGTAIDGAEINAFNTGSYELPPFNVIAVSDERGYFETPSAYSFACTPFEVRVSAAGYQTQNLTFYPPGEEWPDELPESLTITLIARDATDAR